jgi:hypothetical protein
MIKTKLLLILIGIYVCSALLHGQEAIVSAADEFQSEFGHLSISIGELFTAHYSNGSYTIDESILSDYVIEEVNSTDITNELDISVYPNPTSGPINIILQHNQEHNYAIYSITGELLEKGSINDDATYIELNKYKQDFLMLHIKDSSKTLKTFKILKKY